MRPGARHGQGETLGVSALVPKGREPYKGHNLIRQDQERARQLGRQVEVHTLDDGPAGPQIVRLAKDKHFDAIVLALPRERPAEGEPHGLRVSY